MKKKFYLFCIFIVFLFTSKGIPQMYLWSSQTNPFPFSDVNCAWAINSNVCWMCGNSYVIRTINAYNWTNATGNLPSSGVLFYSICGISSNEAWIGTNLGTLYHTINGGMNWILVTLPSPQTPFIDDVHFFNQNTGFIFGDPVNNTWAYYWTTNAGINWTFGPAPASLDTEFAWSNSYCAIDTGHIWFGTNNSKIFKGGLRSGFVPIPITNTDCYSIAFANVNTGVASTNGSFKNTTNGGINWTNGYTPPGIQYSVKLIPGGYQFWSCGAGTTGGTILFSENYGANWTTQFTMSNVGYCLTTALIFRGWVGCANGSIYKNGDPDEINNSYIDLPSYFLLRQNYPNPFNPVTKINYQLPKDGFVLLKIYDFLGREVKTIVNEVKTAGYYSVDFDASTLASGVYFYKMEAGTFTNIKKMMLIK